MSIIKRKNTAVIDFGSQKITAVVGNMSYGGLNILGSSEVEYGGFMEGEFLEIDKLGAVIRQVISLAERNSGESISEVYVGVPATFSTIVTKEISRQFSKKVRITKGLIEGLYESGNTFDRFKSHTLISSDGIDFELDDNEVYTDCIGKVTSSIKANVCYTLVENKFIELVNDIFKMLSIKVEDYICANLAEAQYLDSKAYKNAVIIDCGHITTSVAVVKGNALTAMNEFALGGGYITADLMRWLRLSYECADNMKRKVCLTITPNSDDVYEVKADGDIKAVSARYVNEAVVYRVEKIADAINLCLNKNSNKINDKTNFYLCGGGVSYIKGAKEIIERIIGRNIEILTPDIPSLHKPQYTSVISLLSVASKRNFKKFILF